MAEIRQHRNATTTPAVRAWIQANRHRPTAELMREKGLSRNTVVRWKGREDTADRSSKPQTQSSQFAEWQESLIVELRVTFLLPFDSLLAVVQKFIHPDCKKRALERLLNRNGVNSLKTLVPTEEGQPQPVKSFKDYAPGFLHVDVKYLPQMADETARQYLFVAIDRASRWVHLEILPDKTAASASAFLERLIAAFPGKIEKILTDNGKEFTDRYCRAGEREPTGQHLFDKTCAAHGIEHRLIKPKHPQTNGMVERFNGRIAQILKTTRFQSAQELAETLKNYLHTYNALLPQKAIGYKPPLHALAEKLDQPNLRGMDTS
jgi:transposase InsO family protein